MNSPLQILLNDAETAHRRVLTDPRPAQRELHSTADPRQGFSSAQAEQDPAALPLLREQLQAALSENETLRRRNEELEIRISERTEALEKSQAQLAQSEKMAAIGQLAGGVAHEINNPLASILVFARTASRDLPRNHPARTDLEEIQEAANRCKQTVGSLLTFSRRSQPEKRMPIELAALVRQSLPLIEAATRCRLQLDTVDNLPPIEANAHRLQQVLINLAANADQAMNGMGTATLRVRGETAHVILEVEDEGPGIASETLPHLFEPFFTTKPQGQGTGLGLAIVYGIVREHAGEILVENMVSGGACFQARFPIASSTEVTA